MKKILTICFKELAMYFRSPIAYVALFVCLTAFNLFFYLILDQNHEASLHEMFKVIEFMFMFFIPLLTMKVFSEEMRDGTLEFLMTTPTRYSTIVLGKYLGSLAFVTGMLLFTGIYYIILEIFGAPEKLATLFGYIGLWMETAFFVAIGVMTSSFSRNQIVSAILAYAVLLGLYMTMSLIPMVNAPFDGILRYLCTFTHLENFAIGFLRSSDFIYYLSGIVFCLFITRVQIENKG